MRAILFLTIGGLPMERTENIIAVAIFPIEVLLKLPSRPKGPALRLHPRALAVRNPCWIWQAADRTNPGDTRPVSRTETVATHPTDPSTFCGARHV